MDGFKKFLKKNLSPTFDKRWRVKFLIIAGVLFILFIIFTLIVRTDALRAWDFDTTVRLQDDIPIRFDNFFSSFSLFGRFEFTLIILVIILFLKRKILGLIGGIFLFAVAHIIEIIGKISLSQPGPPHMFLRTTDLSNEFPGFYIHTAASYPSGHAMRTLFIAIIVFFIIYATKKLPKVIKLGIFVGIFVLVAIMLISRVSLGEHWATDVIGGSLLGSSFAFLLLLFI